MITAGRHHQLRIVRLVDPGAVLADADGVEVLLPSRQVPDGAAEGQVLRVFVHHDSDDRLIATTDTPLAEAGQFATLTVVDVTPFGAFVDWGLDKDLLVPLGENGRDLRVGDRVVVHVTVDRHTGRVVGSARLGRFFDYHPTHLRPRQKVELRVFDVMDLGAQVVVDGKHRGLVYADEAYVPLTVGDVHDGWVTRVRDDGRVDVTVRRPGHGGTVDAADRILEALRDAGGTLPLHDRSPPEAIRDALQMSKKDFKRAVGRLYKARQVALVPGGIRLVES